MHVLTVPHNAPTTAGWYPTAVLIMYQVSINERLLVHDFSGTFNIATLMLMLHIQTDDVLPI